MGLNPWLGKDYMQMGRVSLWEHGTAPIPKDLNIMFPIQMTILQCTLYLMFVSTNIGIHISVIWKALINSATWW